MSLPLSTWPCASVQPARCLPLHCTARPWLIQSRTILACPVGLQVLSILWILVGQVLMIQSSMYDNSLYLEHLAQRPSFQIVSCFGIPPDRAPWTCLLRSHARALGRGMADRRWIGFGGYAGLLRVGGATWQARVLTYLCDCSLTTCFHIHGNRSCTRAWEPIRSSSWGDFSQRTASSTCSRSKGTLNFPCGALFAEHAIGDAASHFTPLDTSLLGLDPFPSFEKCVFVPAGG